jgi:hypothetical protein
MQMIDFKRRDTHAGVTTRPSTALRILAGLAGVVVVALLILSWYWSREPAISPLRPEPPAVTGLATTDAAIAVATTLLDKPGGYLTNDVLPPGVLLDNMPNWEYGVLIQLRDLVRVMRNDFGRAQTQSIEDPDLASAEPRFNVDNDSWLFPSAEKEYRKGIEFLGRYRDRLADNDPADGNFFARADNLREWLAVVEKRLGNLSQRLGASVGQRRINVDLANDPSAEAAKSGPEQLDVKTPWLEIDDVFYEARGTAWALVQFLHAADRDFAPVLADKNARASMRQVMRELEDALAPMASPMVLNGRRYGMFANHSLMMASYLSRANAAVINLRELLSRG